MGVHCQGAKINGRIAPLHRELKNGDAIEILTNPSAKPSRDWLSHVRTGRARHKIKQWVRHEEETVSSQLGKEILQREMKRRRLAMPDAAALNKGAALLNMEDGIALEAAVGRGDLALGQVVRALYPEASQEELVEPKPTVFGRMLNRIRLGRGIKIQGVDGLLVRYAQCCQPVPGDSVVGYVTQGRGISIHRADCPNLLTLSAGDRRVEIDWQEQEGESFAVRLVVNAEDRRGLYADILQAISSNRHQQSRRRPSHQGRRCLRQVFVEGTTAAPGKVLKAVRRGEGRGQCRTERARLRDASGPRQRVNARGVICMSLPTKVDVGHGASLVWRRVAVGSVQPPPSRHKSIHRHTSARTTRTAFPAWKCCCKQPARTVTDTAGRFVFRAVAKGTHVIRCARSAIARSGTRWWSTTTRLGTMRAGVLRGAAGSDQGHGTDRVEGSWGSTTD